MIIFEFRLVVVAPVVLNCGIRVLPPPSVRLLERIRFSPDHVLRRYVYVLRTFCISPHCTSSYFIDN